MTVIPGVKAKAQTVDTKYQTGAYITRNDDTLYYVIGRVGTGMLRVENAKTGEQISLTTREVERAKLIRGPAPVEVPDCIPDHFAAGGYAA